MIFIVKKLFHNFVLIEWLIRNEKLESIGLLIVYKNVFMVGFCRDLIQK